MRVSRGENPIFAALLEEYADRRRAAEVAASEADARAVFAEQRALAAERLLRDVEALHEPDAFGQCPTCREAAPCPTRGLVVGDLDLVRALAAVRDALPVVEGDERAASAAPRVPKMADLLDAASPGVDRYFDALLGRNRD